MGVDISIIDKAKEVDMVPPESLVESKPKVFYKWQWEDNGPRWVDYDILTNDQIEESFKNDANEHQFVVGGSKIYEIRFDSLTQCNLATNFERVVRRIAVDQNGNIVEEDKTKRAKPTETKKSKTLTVYQWQWEGPGGWQDYDESINPILNELAVGETASLQFGQWPYDITKVNQNIAMQRNRQTQKVRNARRLSLKKEVDHETTKPTTKTSTKPKQPEFKIDDEQ